MCPNQKPKLNLCFCIILNNVSLKLFNRYVALILKFNTTIVIWHDIILNDVESKFANAYVTCSNAKHTVFQADHINHKFGCVLH